MADQAKSPLWSYLPVRVAAVETVSPNLRRVVFDGPALACFAISPAPDQRVHIAFPRRGEAEPAAPIRAADDTWGYPDEATRPELRNYTVRDWEAASATVDGLPRLTVDFALHEGGVASDWSQQAAIGDRLYLAAGNSWYRPPADCRWQVLVADMTGLPALTRILEGLPDDVVAHVVVELADAEDTPEVAHRPNVLWEAWYGSGHGVAPSALPDAVRRLRPGGGPGYLWAATEAGTARRLRKHGRDAWELERGRHHVVGYWRADEADWLARYAAVQDDVLATRSAAIEAGRTADEVDEIFEDALEQVGL